ncbi:MAG: hypothetical protein Q4D98_03425 [Planctomycetia bacterium]|nr:hypothetical protein [Planctomycetia bacterium]
MSFPLLDPLPENLDTPEFREAWESFVQWRADNLGVVAKNEIFKRTLSLWAEENGVAFAIAALELTRKEGRINTVYKPTIRRRKLTASERQQIECDVWMSLGYDGGIWTEYNQPWGDWMDEHPSACDRFDDLFRKALNQAELEEE